MSHRAIDRCRACDGPVTTVVDLGEQCLTGIFPKSKGVAVDRAPLELVKCDGACGLVQLRHSYEPTAMYGETYGYRSGLNRSMVEHLRAKVSSLLERTAIGAGDVVLDIGSNDGTSLSFYPPEATRIGIDPSATKFAQYYAPGIQVVPDFFSAKRFNEVSRARAKIITSIAMFYDLERPLDFMRDVFDSLAEGGLWHFEQSYMPSMLDAWSYDTICHEHLEYYGMRQILWMCERVGFRVVDVTLNDINGGSFAVTAMKGKGEHAGAALSLVADEKKRALDTVAPYREFSSAIERHRTELIALLAKLRSEGAIVLGMGASTKGNVLLQYCNLSERDLACIADVNPDKFGCVTPGTEIPIVSEADALARKPDVFMVLPWHFRASLVRAHASFLERGGKMLFPLPRIEMVGSTP